VLQRVGSVAFMDGYLQLKVLRQEDRFLHLPVSRTRKNLHVEVTELITFNMHSILSQEGRFLHFPVPRTRNFLHVEVVELSTFNMHSLTPLAVLSCDFRERLGTETTEILGERYKESRVRQKKRSDDGDTRETFQERLFLEQNQG
jgi:hypothetical protein